MVSQRKKHSSWSEKVATHKRFAHTWAAMEKKNLAFAFILYKVCSPNLSSAASKAGVGVLEHESLDHSLNFLVRHYKTPKGSFVYFGLLAECDIERF